MCGCRNVGTLDRAIRAIAGITLLALAYFMLGVAEGAIGGIIAAAIGVVLLLTAALGFCPAYLPMRASTCKLRT